MEGSLKRKGNAGYGQMIADAVLASMDSSPEPPRTRTWLDSWTQPGPFRDRKRRWLSMWLKGDLTNVPEEQAARFLEEMASDVRAIGTDEAVNRFIDKILPKILSNGPPA